MPEQCNETCNETQHALATAVTGWTCIKCRTHFDTWPTNDEWCPFPPDDEP